MSTFEFIVTCIVLFYWFVIGAASLKIFHFMPAHLPFERNIFVMFFYIVFFVPVLIYYAFIYYLFWNETDRYVFQMEKQNEQI